MPVKDFRWLTNKQIGEIDWLNTTEESNTGYIVECDLEYGEHLHVSHNAYPICPEQRTITEDMLSERAKECLRTIKGEKFKYKSTKLIGSFLPRKKYCIHYIALRTALQLGLKLTGISRVISFTQKDIIRPYIELCTEQRKKAKSKFDQTIYKAFVCSLFGKTVERVRDRKDCKFTTTAAQYGKWASSPRFISQRIMNENFVIVYLKPTSIRLNKPIFLGFTILDLSKEWMWSQYYNVLKPAFDDRVQVIMSDTDSFCLAIRTADKVNNLSKLHSLMDYSNYSPDHPRHSNRHKNDLNFWKNESKGNKIIAASAVRSKVYSLRSLISRYNVCPKMKKVENQNKCKGTKKNVCKQIPFEYFKNCALGISQVKATQFSIVSKSHSVSLKSLKRVCFNSFDDKMSMSTYCTKRVHSFPYGSKLLLLNYCYLCKHE
jgi:hypothetical protein